MLTCAQTVSVYVPLGNLHDQHSGTQALAHRDVFAGAEQRQRGRFVGRSVPIRPHAATAGRVPLTSEHAIASRCARSTSC